MEDMFLGINSSNSFTHLDRYRCPKCGYESSSITEIYIDGKRNKICTRCYFDWILANVPELVKID